MDINSREDDDNAELGVYLAATTAYGSFWRSILFGGPLIIGDPHIPYRATLGNVVSMTGDWDATSLDEGALLWDEDTELTVDLIYGELVSVTEEEIYQGKNDAALAGEIIQFQNATVVVNEEDEDGLWDGKKRYLLTKLLRGRRGTENLIENHAGGSYFCLLDNAVVFWRTRAVYLNGSADFWVEHPALTFPDVGQIDDTFTQVGNNMKPYSPVNVTAEWLSPGGDIKLSWDGRSRYSDLFLLTGANPPLGEDREEYLVEIIDDADEVLRALTGIMGVETVTYTEAQRDADALDDSITSLHLRIYQISAVVGRGHVADVEVEIQ
jgi:hypothetical protein